MHDTSDSDGFVALENGAIVGFALYEMRESQCELLVLESVKENQGVGTSLLDAVKMVARENACTRVWLITTNDNTHAIRYYQRRGFELTAVYIDAMTESRRLKPSIPPAGFDDIPIKHEFEFATRL
ncbi:MAG: GNAT family N-acetyltransferase [Thermomicrobiales bacterium]|nr:GNAT family N-acetyltransferase [Thermomicrobiales bacterium]